MRRGFGRPAAALGLLALALVLWWFLAAPGYSGRRSASGGSRVVVTIGGGAVGRPVRSGFLGLSLEYFTLAAYTLPGAADPVLVRLIRDLSPGQRPVIRIGGDSTDWSWWPVRGLRRPLGVTYGLSAGWIQGARALADATDARLVLGINLEANSAVIAGAEARALLAGIGRGHVEALEVGNEPELYGRFVWFRQRNRRAVRGRPVSYGITTYTAEFSKFRRALPRIALAGPATGDRRWLSRIGPFLAAERALRMVTFHAYGLGCAINPRSLSYPTVEHLLRPLALQEQLYRLPSVLPEIAIAHRHHVAFRIAETNSVTCGGTRGVSNSFASALWALDSLFEVARDGVDGVNFHTRNGTESKLFAIQRLADGRWLAAVQPEYYGLLMFARAAPPGSRLLRTTSPGGREVRAWATLAPDRQMRVVLINDSITHPRVVLVRTADASGAAVLERLQAPSAYATADVTLAGQSFGNWTATGTLAGPKRITSLKPINGEYTVLLPAATAAMLTIATNVPNKRVGPRVSGPTRTSD